MLISSYAPLLRATYGQAYTHAIFYDFAGSLIGLTCVFSLIIPLSTMLRALVLEREDQLRETLFIMGS